MGDFLFNWLPLVALVALCLFGLYLVVIGIRALSKAKRLASSGVDTVAYVTEKTIEVSIEQRDSSDRRERRKQETHYLSYAFVVDGAEFTGKEISPSDLWRASEEGSEVDIRYDRDDPNVNRLTAWAPQIATFSGGLQAVVGGLMAGGALIFLGMSALDAYRGSEPVVLGEGWVETYGIVRWVRVPEDPFLRIFAPDARRIYVDIGEMAPGKLYSERETLIYPYQSQGIVLEAGSELKAFIDPDNEFYSILAIEQTPR